MISGTFEDRPGYQLHNSGSITAQVADDCHFVITSVAMNGGSPTAGGEQWTKSRFNFVRCWGNLFFDADPNRPGTQSTGPRTNDKVSIFSSYRRCAK